MRRLTYGVLVILEYLHYPLTGIGVWESACCPLFFAWLGFLTQGHFGGTHFTMEYIQFFAEAVHLQGVAGITV